MKKSLLLILLMALLAPWATYAQDVTIGDGASTQNSAPIANYYNYSLTEMIFTAEEIAAGSPQVNTILSVGFECTSDVNKNYGVTVYMKNVELTSFSSESDYVSLSESDVVFSGTVSPSSGWTTIELATPFEFNPSKNLLVAINKTSGGYSGSSAIWKYTSASGKMLYAQNDNSVVDVSTGSYVSYSSTYYVSANANRPNTKLTFGTPASCPKPIGLEATLTPGNGTIATLSWTAGGTETDWVLEYGNASNFNGATSVNVSGTPSKDLTGLTAETTYYARVKADCGGDGESEWSNVISFKPTNYYSLTVNNRPSMSTTSYIPFYGYYAQYETNSQFILPADSLLDAAGGSINSLSFYTSSTPNWGAAEFDVYIKEVDYSAFANTTPVTWSTMTNVYSGGVSVSEGKMTIEFNQPYAYNGGNLVIGFKEKTPGTSSSASWVAYYGSTYVGLYGYKNSSTGNVSYSRNQYAIKTTLAYLPSSTPRVESITQGAITASSATFSWIAPSTNVTGYAYQYKLASDENWPAAWSNTTATAVTLTGLNAGTSYEFRIKALYGSDESVSSSVSFITLFSIPTIEGFDTTICPLGWSRYSGLLEDVMAGTSQLIPTTSGWNFNTGNGVFDNHAKVNIYGTSCQYWLVTPTIVMEANVQLTFDLALTKFSGTLAAVDPTQQADDKFVVLASTDNGANWTILRQWDNAGSQDVYDDIACSATGQSIKINLEDYSSGNLMIAFYGESTVSGGDNNLHIDNVSIDLIPDCAKPTGLSASEISKHAVTLSWTNGEEGQDAWKVAYKVDDENVTDFAEVDVTANPYTLDGLEAETDYVVKVRANCGSGSLSDYSAEISVSTPIACIAPLLTNTGITNITAHSADVAWAGDPGAVGFTVSYRTAAYMDGIDEGFENSTLPSGWTKEGPGTWAIGTGNNGYSGLSAHSGSYNAKAGHQTRGNETYLVTPSIDLSGKNGAHINLWYTNEAWGSDIDGFGVYYRVNGGEWNEIFATTTGHSTWTNIDEELPAGALAANCQFGFKFTDNYGYGVTLDDVKIGESIPAGDWVDEIVTASPKTITGLVAETKYEVKVKGDCGEDGESAESVVRQFTTASACQMPDGLAAADITALSASISWNTYGLTDFKLRYKADTAGAAWSDPVAVAQPHVLAGLAANTAYKVQVQPTCNLTVWSDSMSFRTDCAAISELPYSYDFETTDKFACWTVVDPNVAIDSYSAHSGAKKLKFSGSEPNIIALPNFEAELNTLRLEFWTRPENSGGSSGMFDVGYMTDLNDISTFTVVETYDGTTWESSPAYVLKTIDFNEVPANTNAYIAMRQYSNTSYYYWFVDDVTVKLIPSCEAPTDLAVNYTGGQTATVTWTGDAEAYNIDVNGTVTNNVSNPYSLEGLELATTYNVKVQADCGTSGTSEWTDVLSFTTDACANMCEITFELTDDYGDGWDDGAALNIVDATTTEIIESLTLASGSSKSGTVRLCSGLEVNFVWVDGVGSYGDFNYESGYSITDANGEIICSHAGGDENNPPTPGVVANYIVCSFLLNINASGYATFYDEARSYELPADLTGHVFSTQNTPMLVQVYDGGDVVPASTPLVMKAGDGADLSKPFVLRPSTNAGVAPIGAFSQLHGVNTDSTIVIDTNCEFFVLSLAAAPDNTPESVGFYYYSEEKKNGGFLLKAHKAYLKVPVSELPSGAPSAFFLFNGENGATWLENLEGVEGTVKFLHEGKIFILREGVIYDATGRQVRKL